jgi:uroporphyrinogen decarboxylase
MNSTDRVLACLNHEEPDRLPVFALGFDYFFCDTFYREIGFTRQEKENYAKDGLFFAPPYNFPIHLKMGVDVGWFSVAGGIHVEEGQMVDTFGSIQTAIVKDGIPMNWFGGPYLTSETKIKEWWAKDRPKKYGASLFGTLKKKRDILLKNHHGFCLIGGIPGPFELISMPLGFALMSKLMRKKPELVHELMERNWIVSREALRRQLKEGQKIIMCGDDLGMNEGLLLRKEQWQTFIKPTLKKYVDEVHNGGGKFILHSCGKIESLFPDFVGIGIDGVESLKPQLNNLNKLKEKFGKQISFLGCVDDTHLLFEGTQEEVYKTVQNQCKILGKGGGFIPGGTNFIGNIPIANYQAMVRAIKEYKFS